MTDQFQALGYKDLFFPGPEEFQEPGQHLVRLAPLVPEGSPVELQVWVQFQVSSLSSFHPMVS